MGLLSGKTALITGGARGIGKAVALRFAAEGADVAFTDLALNGLTDAVRAEVSAFGVRCAAYAADAADYAKTREVVAAVCQELGRIDILVNNAGITRDGLLMRMSEEQWDEVIRVNLKSAFNYTREVAPVMARQRSGSIINMSSIVGIGGNAGQANYSASKAGLIALAKSVAMEFGSRGVRANCVAPGYIISDMTAKLPEALKEQWIAATPLRRGGTVEEVANTVLFLASDLSSFISGQVLRCDGGFRG